MSDDEIKFEVDARVIAPGPQPPSVRYTKDLKDARLPGGADAEVRIDGVTFERVDCSGIRFWYFDATESLFVDCDFSRISSREGGYLGGYPAARFVGCNFDRADLRHLRPGWARFERCAFTNVRMRDWNTSDSSFVDCVFSGRVEHSIFYGRRAMKLPGMDWPPPDNDFHGNDFSDADLIDTSFREGIDLSKQRLPGGPDYLLLDRWPERVDRARAAIAGWQPDVERNEASNILEIYWNEDARQNWKLIRRDDLGRFTPQAVLDRLHDELARPLRASG